MWYGVQNMSKYDIDIKVQPLYKETFVANYVLNNMTGCLSLYNDHTEVSMVSVCHKLRQTNINLSKLPQNPFFPPIKLLPS